MGEAAAAGWTHPSIIPTIRGEDALFAPSPELTDFAHNLLDCKVVGEISIFCLCGIFLPLRGPFGFWLPTRREVHIVVQSASNVRRCSG